MTPVGRSRDLPVPMRVLKKLKRSTVYGGTRLFISLCNRVPRRVAVFVAGWLGLAAWKLLPRDRYRAHRHLWLVYGDRLSWSQRENLGRTMFVNFGRNLADMARMRRHYASEIRPLVTVEGLEHFDAAYRQGKGVIGITGHIGNFELMGVHVASLGYDIAVIGRKMYDARLDQLLVENRRALGLTNFATTDSPHKVLSWLRSGRAIGVLIDTDSRRVRSMFMPAFGRLSNTPVGQSIIGLRAGAAFVPMACLRCGGGRYRIVIRPQVEITASGDLQADVRRLTLLCTKALEEIIHCHRDQWIWLHNRWRTPAGIAP